MEKIVSALNGLIWSNWLVGLCLAAGFFFSLILRFPQVRHLPGLWRYLFGGVGSSRRGVSSFQAFALAVSGRVGTGNIAGVAAAIAMGGPGAVFWMWLIAFVGAGSAFTEAALAQIYKEQSGGQFRGGPAHYIAKGLRMRWYAVIFAVSTIIAAGICLPGIQSHSIAAAVESAFSIPAYVSGVLVALLLGVIIVGGVKRIGRVAQFMVPFMAAGYILVALIVLLANLPAIPGVFRLIFESAFGFGSAGGGMLGAAIAYGVRRGIYSNEAGQGTGPIVAAAAEVRHPAEQGLVQAFSVYFDTWFVCTATALVILITGQYNVVDPAGGFLVENIPGVEAGPVFTQLAVDTVLPGVGAAFVAIALFFFAFTSLMAYYYYAETNLDFLLPSGRYKRLAVRGLQLAFLAIVVAGSVRSSSLAWGMGDIGVGLMAWLNIIAILFLSKIAIRCLRDFERQQKAGGPITFHGPDIGVPESPVWNRDPRD